MSFAWRNIGGFFLEEIKYMILPRFISWYNPFVKYNYSDIKKKKDDIITDSHVMFQAIVHLDAAKDLTKKKKWWWLYSIQKEALFRNQLKRLFFYQ